MMKEIGTEIEIEIVIGIETEIVIEIGTEIENEKGTEIEIETGIEIGTEKGIGAEKENGTEKGIEIGINAEIVTNISHVDLHLKILSAIKTYRVTIRENLNFGGIIPVNSMIINDHNIDHPLQIVHPHHVGRMISRNVDSTPNLCYNIF